MTDQTAGQAALDKLEAAETLARFYAVSQRYDCHATGYEELEELIADEMAYLTSNLRDPTPVPRDQFLTRFKELHDVHAYKQRGSFYALAGPIVSVTGDSAHVTAHISICHWLGPAVELSTWFYGAIDADLVRSTPSWRIARLDVANIVRLEGHLPKIDAFHPHID